MAGSWLTLPTCSNSWLTAQYAIAIPKLTPMPAVAPRFAATKANGTEISAMITANNGIANFLWILHLKANRVEPALLQFADVSASSWKFICLSCLTSFRK